MRIDAGRFLDIFDSLDYHIAIYDRDWRYTYVNAEAARILGRPIEELIGYCIWDLFPDAVGNQYHRELHEAAAQGRIIHSDHYYAPFERWFANHIYPLPEGVLVLSRDITQTKNREEALAEREQMLRLAQRAGGVATFEWDTRSGAARCSEELFRMFGLPDRPGGTLESQEWDALLHPDDRERMAQHLTRIISGAEPAAADYRIVRPDGDVRWLTYAAQMQETPHGHRLFGTVLDITDRKHLELALREAKAVAEGANQLKDQFLATISHELRTPLNVMLGYARILQTDGLPDDRRAAAIGVIERNAMLQNRLVEDLLDMARIATSKVRLAATSVDLEAILREAVEGVQLAADAKGVTLDVEIDQGDEPFLADGARLQQVLHNLLSNAVKFSDRGDSVSIRLRRDATTVEISVSDTGAGIAPAFLPVMFEPFRQADPPFARTLGGLGLGLSISKQLVELHGGTLEAASDGPGLGSTFTVRLPISVEPATSSQQDA